MKKYVLSLILAGSLLGANTLKYEEFSGFENPESVFVDKNFVYVSNLGKKIDPLGKDNDGFISKLDKNGKILEYKFLNKLHAPKGMLELNQTLYVADIDVLRGFDLKTKEEIFNLPIKGAIFLNDIEKLDDNTLLLSDTGTGLILKINLKTKEYEELIRLDLNQFGGPNGLYLDRKNNKLFIAGYHIDGVSHGLVVSYDLNSKKVDIIKNEKESYDGIVPYGDALLVSSWGENLQGVVYKINKANQSIKLDLPLMKGPADIFVENNNLWIPKMIEGKIMKVVLEK
ncbi:ATP-binding protein [Campylobacter hepaticus]|uniref:YncE family protein n=1 Tax=Campylobacter hepaticus TaxID=1813019 RepID=UPI0018C1415B|nr:ATP-binding protein [Campylobacter hepaticus]MDX2330565.1 ATP-binding protein [Campylobacter hepaticus]MDX2371182.1 ATP-binding protein [Campylobacter hepaticus]MDX2397172.1 ATP-binding protein [Campylobacter hepaticus]MDX5508339.1 ATP-binding protein [Campylobacter hepaticus]QOW63317.1 ATP-binding protein [Campylobacter hepaticus]